jgi:nickel-dependent lactate racemase
LPVFFCAQLVQMRIPLAYGKGTLDLNLDLDSDAAEDRVQVILPISRPGLPDERLALREALHAPVGTAALEERLGPDRRVCIVFTDITRATPNHRLIPWLLEYLLDHGVTRENITLLNSTGTHRGNTPEELAVMLTPEVSECYRIINHDCHATDEMVAFGQTRGGAPALINRHLVEADVRIITGFIEPHFFAGFSGGPKGIMPGVAGLETVMCNHGAKMIGDPAAVFGVLDENPIWCEMRDIALRVGDSFLINVTLNDDREITGVFAGDLIRAHREGCEFVRTTAMQAVAHRFDVVVTTNSGYPLDMNLYQGVKGMSAAARVLKPGGLLILACECSEGIPTGSPFDQLLRSATGPDHILQMLAQPGFVRAEQWQAHIQSLISLKARVLLYSSLAPDLVRAAHLEPCADIGAAVEEELRRVGGGGAVAVLPQGPLTIPYLHPQ